MIESWSDDSIRSVAIVWPNLICLRVRGSMNGSSEPNYGFSRFGFGGGDLAVLESLKNLTTLDLSKCSDMWKFFNTSSHLATLTQLTSLDISKGVEDDDGDDLDEMFEVRDLNAYRSNVA